jgi:hypothetical protein
MVQIPIPVLVRLRTAGGLVAANSEMPTLRLEINRPQALDEITVLWDLRGRAGFLTCLALAGRETRTAFLCQPPEIPENQNNTGIDDVHKIPFMDLYHCYSANLQSVVLRICRRFFVNRQKALLVVSSRYQPFYSARCQQNLVRGELQTMVAGDTHLARRRLNSSQSRF